MRYSEMWRGAEWNWVGWFRRNGGVFYRLILSLLLSLFVLQLLKEGMELEKFDGEIVNDDRERKITGI